MTNFNMIYFFISVKIQSVLLTELNVLSYQLNFDYEDKSETVY